MLTWIVILGFAGCMQENKTSGLSKNEYMVMATLWYQTSAEARALYYQAFNLAQVMLDEHLRNHTSKKKPAIIFDIDETLLDNSPYQGKQIHDNINYPAGWKEWTALAQAQALPGVIAFLKYADEKGVAIFYVSNRRVEEKEGTMKNMKALDFPQVQDDRFYLRTESSGKEPRRQAVAENHEILLLVGDNLNDFSEVFEKKAVQDRKDEVDKLKAEFGRRFIVVPNPMYGEWEGAVYNYNWGMKDGEKDAARKKAVKGH